MTAALSPLTITSAKTVTAAACAIGATDMGARGNDIALAWRRLR